MKWHKERLVLCCELTVQRLKKPYHYHLVDIARECGTVSQRFRVLHCSSASAFPVVSSYSTYSFLLASCRSKIVVQDGFFFDFSPSAFLLGNVLIKCQIGSKHYIFTVCSKCFLSDMMALMAFDDDSNQILASAAWAICVRTFYVCCS